MKSYEDNKIPLTKNLKQILVSGEDEKLKNRCENAQRICGKNSANSKKKIDNIFLRVCDEDSPIQEISNSSVSSNS